MQDKRRLDASMALDLAELTNRSAVEWLAVQATEDLAKARQRPNTAARLGEIAARADLEKQVPVRELIKRGAISATDTAVQARQVAELLGDDPTFGVSAKRSTAEFTRTQAAWIALARQYAWNKAVADFDKGSFERLVVSLPRKVLTPEDFADLPHTFAAAGVALVYVKPFPGGRIDGVSMALGANPLIALSGRGKRFDKVFFALLHECAHVLNDHWVSSPRLHEGGVEYVAGEQDIEQVMNDQAASWIFPDGLSMVGPLNQAATKDSAAVHGVSQALVVGHLQHRGVIEWSSVLGRRLPNVDEVLAKWR
jgi:HTH-type transcriptional regulator/antitoxin HigA